MPEQVVPASTKIHKRSLPNVGVGRLLRRLEFLRIKVTQGNLFAEQKNDYKQVVMQCVWLERELEQRGIPHVRITRRKWQ